MMNKPLNFQREVKENAEEYQTYLKELYHWEDEIKVKDENLKKSTSSCTQQSEHPIRGKNTGMSTDDTIVPSSKTKWEIENITDNQKKQKAIIEKDKGNQFFKELQYEKAIMCYSAAIDLNPNDAILYANRAMAYLKISKFKEAEEDCHKSIWIDPNFVKAYHRRGVARLSQGMKNQAITDFEEVLLREPHNKAAQQELERLKSTSQNTDVKVKKTTPKDEIVTRKGKVVEIVEKHDHQRFSELSSETLKLTHPSLVTVETFSNLSSSSLSEPKHNIKIIKVNDNQHEKRVVENIIKQVNVKNTIPEAPTPIEVVQKSVCHVIPAVPKHYAQFNQEWNKLRDMDELKFSYLKKITPAKLPEIFRESLEADVLGDIIRLLSKESALRNEPVHPWLHALSQVKRIRAVVLFLPSDLKSELVGLTKSLSTSKEFSEEDRQSIFQSFGV